MLSLYTIQISYINRTCVFFANVQLGWNLGCVYCNFSTYFTNTCVILFCVCVCVLWCVCVFVCRGGMIISQTLFSIRTQSFIDICVYVKTQKLFNFWNCIFFVVWEWNSDVIFVFAASISVSTSISDRCRRNLNSFVIVLIPRSWVRVLCWAPLLLVPS